MSYQNPFLQSLKDAKAYSNVNKCIGQLKVVYNLENDGGTEGAGLAHEKIEVTVDLKDPDTDNAFTMHRTWRDKPNIQDVAFDAVSDFAIANGLAEDFEVEFKLISSMQTERRDVDNPDWVRVYKESSYLVFHTID